MADKLRNACATVHDLIHTKDNPVKATVIGDLDFLLSHGHISRKVYVAILGYDPKIKQETDAKTPALPLADVDEPTSV